MHYDYNAIDSATGEISAPDWFKELDAAKGDVSSLLFDNDDAFMVCRVFLGSISSIAGAYHTIPNLF